MPAHGKRLQQTLAATLTHLSGCVVLASPWCQKICPPEVLDSECGAVPTLDKSAMSELLAYKPEVAGFASYAQSGFGYNRRFPAHLAAKMMLGNAYLNLGNGFSKRLRLHLHFLCMCIAALVRSRTGVSRNMNPMR